MARTSDEIAQQIETQLRFLKKSCAEFDAGDLQEAVRIANVVCTLVEDGRRRIKSVLTQAGARDSLMFLASGSPVNPRNLLSEAPLTKMRLFAGGGKDGAKYLPILGDAPFPPRPLRFGEWWGQPIFKDRAGHTLTRNALCRSLRDQEGGTHFDEELSDDVYYRLAKENAAGWVVTTPSGTTPIDPGPHFATMRQIGWEVEQTLAGFRPT